MMFLGWHQIRSVQQSVRTVRSCPFSSHPFQYPTTRRFSPLNSLNPIVGKISLPSTTLRFFDLGGQASIRSIWEKYYDECHAVVFVLDSADQARLSEAWEVFGECDNKERRETTV
jgi:GTPase SAR1 family protein